MYINKGGGVNLCGGVCTCQWDLGNHRSAHGNHLLVQKCSSFTHKGTFYHLLLNLSESCLELAMCYCGVTGR